MTRAPVWTDEEFEILLQNPRLSPDELRHHLPGRSSDAIAIVRSGIHAFHAGLDTSMLSKMMMSRLESAKENAICPICGLSLR